MKNSDKRRKRREVELGHATAPRVRLPKALFSTGWDEVANEWHKKPDAPKDLLPSMRLRMALESIRVAEALLISPKVSFRVHGENVVICHLIDQFGVAGVEQLLEEGAIEFILMRGGLAHWERSDLDGLMPLAPLTLNSPAHSDPRASNELGLRGWCDKPWPQVSRLAKLATERTILPAEKLSRLAVDAVFAAYRAGALIGDGLNPAEPLDRLPLAKRTILSQLGGDVYEGTLLLENDYDFHEARKSWEALVKVCSRIPKDERIVRTVESVLRLEGLPSLRGLLADRALSFADILRVRREKATLEFREWLWGQPDPRDAEAVGNAYTREITGKNATERNWFKLAKIGGITLATSTVGHFLGDAVGGGVAATVGGGLLGASASLGEVFGLDKLVRGLSPRRFAEEVVRPRFVAHHSEPGQPSKGNRRARRQQAASQRKSRR